MSGWSERTPNPRFPACAMVARRLLAEVYGCKPGDVIPPEDELLATARVVAADDLDAERGKAVTVLAMVTEIGGL